MILNNEFYMEIRMELSFVYKPALLCFCLTLAQLSWLYDLAGLTTHIFNETLKEVEKEER